MSSIIAKSNLRKISKGKDPKEPREGYFLEICKKDFRSFKDKEAADILQLLSSIVKTKQRREDKPSIFRQQKDSLENVFKLLKEGKEEDAFSQFYRAFPTCMPYRSTQNNLK